VLRRVELQKAIDQRQGPKGQMGIGSALILDPERAVAAELLLNQGDPVGLLGAGGLEPAVEAGAIEGDGDGLVTLLFGQGQHGLKTIGS